LTIELELMITIDLAGKGKTGESGEENWVEEERRQLRTRESP